MNTSELFSQKPWGDGLLWATKCVGLASVIGAGWMTGYLQATCVMAIIGFVVWQGLLPFAGLSRDLDLDIQRCHGEKVELQDCGIELASAFTNLDTRESGSIFRLCVAIKKNEDRLNKAEAVGLFLEVAEKHWKKKLLPIDNAAEQAPLLGLGGSLLGILGALANLANTGAESVGLHQSMAVMVSTTLAGCAGALLLIGLAAIARGAIDRHLAELQLIAALLFGSDEKVNQNDDFESLF